jgi:hypothetical protein
MRYMLLLYVTDRPAPGTPEGDALFAEVRSFHRRWSERGAVVSSAPLAAPHTARTVRIRDGNELRTDGPFAETTEWLAGYFVLECETLDDALAIAADCPTARSGSVEVRPQIDTGVG